MIDDGEAQAGLLVQQRRSFTSSYLKTARTLGLELTPTVVANADEVIE